MSRGETQLPISWKPTNLPVSMCFTIILSLGKIDKDFFLHASSSLIRFLSYAFFDETSKMLRRSISSKLVYLNYRHAQIVGSGRYVFVFLCEDSIAALSKELEEIIHKSIFVYATNSQFGPTFGLFCFFLEVSTLLTMTTVATINRLVTMAGRNQPLNGFNSMGTNSFMTSRTTEDGEIDIRIEVELNKPQRQTNLGLSNF
ncbi:hypothetical protein HAX54_000898 [Datura stramonium]|uniref:Uncharacterized protein n=1 Tax=Datura stramonium TaxID=4076 RepID=A0ABS8T2S5_DATST|nr:hypothetical protein [Datura stramonium]